MNLEVKGVERFGTFKGNDVAFMSMGLEADLGDAFSWNTKTVFLYVEAEWETPLNKRNQVLLWDRIIESREEGVLSLPHLRKPSCLSGGPARAKMHRARSRHTLD